MMTRTCRAPGCRAPAASSFAAYCTPHRTALRRHGAVDQKAITKAQLKPYLKLVKGRISKNPENIAWVGLDERWRVLVGHAEGILAEFAKGRPGGRYERLAAQEVVKLAGDAKPRAVVEVAAAVVMMRELEPRHFRSDDAFWMQLARRVRSITNLHVGESWDNVRGRVRRHYRELNPRAARTLGRWLAKMLGIGGLHIARLELAERERKAQETRELHDALSKLA
jgi:hypothetical protein